MVMLPLCYEVMMEANKRLPPRVKDRTGYRYGRLVVTAFSHCTQQGAHWHCACDCGGTKVALAASLTKNNTRSCGCLNAGADGLLPAGTKDETGKRYGLITIERYSHSKDGTHWIGRCDCGSVKSYAAHSFRRGMTNSCGCNSDKVRSAKLRLPDNAAEYNRLVTVYKRHARNRGYEWTISREECITLFKGDCFYCGVGHSNTLPHLNGLGAITYNGIDRVDNTAGYTRANTVSCCKMCNAAKRDYGVAEFLTWAMRVASHSAGLVLKETA